MSKIVLRPYQDEANKKTVNWLSDSKTDGKSGLVVMPVAAGKSILIAKAVEHAKSLGYGVIILQPSVELLLQNYDKYIRVGGEATIYSASAGIKEMSLTTYVTLGSVKKLASQFLSLTKKWVFIMDEAHFSFSPTEGSMFKQFEKEIKPVKVVGYTATPFILKRNGMEGDTMLNIMTRVRPRVFTDFIHVEQVSSMIKGNYWAPLKFVEYAFDEGLLRFNSTGSEYTEESIQSANAAMGVNNNIYKDALRICEENPKAKVLIFMDSVDNAAKMHKALSKKLKSGVVAGETTKSIRSGLVEEFSNGDLQVLINYGVFTTGFDAPSMTHVLIGRPTNSFSLFYQIQGRVVRLHPLGLDATVVDYCGNIKRFGKIEELIIADFEEYGWGATSGGFLLTKVPVGSRVSLEQVIADSKKNPRNVGAKTGDGTKIPFGKFAGKELNSPSVNLGYLRWMHKECNLINYPMFKEALEKYLEVQGK